jgi:hypothetical protein
MIAKQKKKRRKEEKKDIDNFFDFAFRKTKIEMGGL